MSRRDYYKILGVKRSASPKDIKARFRKLALRYHPDLNPGRPVCEEHFKLVAEAYHVLSNQQLRSLYNQEGHEGLRRDGYRGFLTTEDVLKAFGASLFSFLGLSGAQPPRGPLPGADLCLELELSSEQAAVGARKTIEIARMETCSQCRGSGTRRSTGELDCYWCRGRGEFSGVSNIFATNGVCAKCGGSGRLPFACCSGCSGEGRRLTLESLEVEIPAGVTQETRL